MKSLLTHSEEEVFPAMTPRRAEELAADIAIKLPDDDDIRQFIELIGRLAYDDDRDRRRLIAGRVSRVAFCETNQCTEAYLGFSAFNQDQFEEVQ